MNKDQKKARKENRILIFGNLTRPILDQMLQAQGAERNALRHLEQVLSDHKMTSGQYACLTPAGSVEIKISPRRELRTALRFRSAPMTYGPDELRNKQLSISRVDFPPNDSVRDRRPQDWRGRRSFANPFGPPA